MRLFILFCLFFTGTTASTQNYFLFIGTYTDQGSKGIYVYRFNAANGQATWLSNTDSVSNPSFLTVSSNGRFVYAVNENAPGTVSSFSFDRKTARLKFISQQSSEGDHPCYIASTKNNKWVVVGNYTGGNFSVLPVQPDGSLQSARQIVQHKGSGANKDRQEKPHVHATVFSPRDNFLYVPDLGIDKVMVYPFNTARSKPVDTLRKSHATSVPGGGPRHFTFHPNGKFAYLMEELSGTVAAYQVVAGKLKLLQRISSHPKDYKGGFGSADIHVSPDGKFLYASNRADANSIAIFSVLSNGKLVSKGFQPTLGVAPRNFMIDPTGNFLLVANQRSDKVVIFRRNKQTGLLRDTGNHIEVSRPVCLQMVK